MFCVHLLLLCFLSELPRNNSTYNQSTTTPCISWIYEGVESSIVTEVRLESAFISTINTCLFIQKWGLFRATFSIQHLPDHCLNILEDFKYVVAKTHGFTCSVF